jgi:hypothetical protein
MAVKSIIQKPKAPVVATGSKPRTTPKGYTPGNDEVDGKIDESKVTKPGKEKATKVPKEKKERAASISSLAIKLLIAGELSDDEIKKQLAKEFPAQAEKAGERLNCKRFELNKGKIIREGFDPSTKQLERMLRVDGKLIPYSQRPVTEKKTATRKPVDPKNDPLKKFGLTDPKAAAKAKTPVTPVAKKTGAKK